MVAAGRMVSRFGVGLTLLAALTPAAATSLCRDGKGLFTPCPREANKVAQAILASAPGSVDVMAHEPVAHRPRAAAPDSSRGDPSPIRRTRLCTDTRGLFTPCPR